MPVVDPLPKMIMPSNLISQSVELLKSAKRPLVIIGKGVGQGEADEQIRAFIKKTNLPYLATPMGKGSMPDTDSHSVATARTYCLKNADVIFLACARLNWILHFGEPPRFSPNVKIIQLDSDPLEMHQNV